MLPDPITPALYGITKKIAAPVIKHQWDNLIVPMLVNEERLYRHAFDVFAFTKSQTANEDFGLKIFLLILQHEDFQVKHEQIPIAVFEVYWDLAENQAFWQPAGHGQQGRQIAHDDVVVKWTQDHIGQIEWCKEVLQIWLAEN